MCPFWVFFWGCHFRNQITDYRLQKNPKKKNIEDDTVVTRILASTMRATLENIRIRGIIEEEEEEEEL